MSVSVLTAVLQDSEGREVGRLIVSAKQFKTGSRGLFGQGFQRFGGASRQHYLIAVGQHGLRHRLADAARGARDQCDLCLLCHTRSLRF